MPPPISQDEDDLRPYTWKCLLCGAKADARSHLRGRQAAWVEAAAHKAGRSDHYVEVSRVIAAGVEGG